MVSPQPRYPSLVYQYMEEHVEGLYADPHIKRIWRGYAKEIAEELDINIKLIYRAVSTLLAVESIKKLKHGANQSPSVYELIKAPTDHDVIMLNERSLMTDRLEAPSQYQRLQDSITRLTNRLNDVERRLGEIDARYDTRRSTSLS